MKYLLKISSNFFSAKALFLLCLVACALNFSSCGYKFKDISIGNDVKTFYVGFITNKARYVNPQLSPQLTERLRLKINTQTKLKNVDTDDADFDINGYVSDYSVTTSGISN